MKAIIKRGGKSFFVRNIHKMSEHYDEFKCLHGGSITHTLPLLVEAGAVEELHWRYCASGTRRNIRYKRLFEEDDIEYFIDKMEKICEERKDEMHPQTREGVPDIQQSNI